MGDERSQPPYNQSCIVPAEYAGASLLAKDGDELFGHYRHALERLGSTAVPAGIAESRARRNDCTNWDRGRRLDHKPV
jgi:type I restriction enzyme M protein